MRASLIANRLLCCFNFYSVLGLGILGMKKYLLVLLIVSLTGCAKVGSERWCENLEGKPKGDWSMNEASDYAKNCILK